jgi:RHS repeat-associated protein
MQQSYSQAGALAKQRAGHNSHFGMHALDYAEPAIAIVNREYGYNQANDLTKVDDNRWGQTHYQHDRSARLVGAANQAQGTEQFHYDLIGQIRQKHQQAGHYHPDAPEPTAFHHNAQGLPERAGPCHYAYDQKGRVIRKTVHRKGFRPKTWYYAWNTLDQLIRVTTPTGKEWQYAYDPLGRRINKYNPQTHTSHHYTWDGDVILQEIILTGEGEAQQTNITTWHHEGFTPLIKEQQGQVYHVITDPVGTPKELLTAEGELAWSGYHQTWGQLYQTRYGRRENQTDCPIRYPGQYEDAESGLHYNRFRYYDPDIGQYLSPDPIGLEGGLQPHAYVPDPNGWMDPLGLAGCRPVYNPKSNRWHDPKTGRFVANPNTFPPPKAILPINTGGKTQGVLHTPGQNPLPLTSGVKGPSQAIRGQGLPGFNGNQLTHVEGHAAAHMRINNIQEAILDINKAPCIKGSGGGCAGLLPRMLPEGARLTVRHPGGTDVFIGLPD